MPTTAADIMATAGILLNDEDHIRWPPPELRTWINDGLKAIVLAKPSAKSSSRILSLAAGTLQSIVAVAGDPTPTSLITVTRNITAEGPPRIAGRTITVASRAVLDAVDPDWHTARAKAEVRQIVFDEQNPLEFYVTPPNDGTGKVEAVCAVIPTLVAAPSDPDSVASYTDAIDLPNLYDPVLVDYVCYRAHQKDSTAAEPGMADSYFSKFATALGIKIQVEGASSLNTRRRQN